MLVVLHEEVLGGATAAVLRLLSLLETRGWRFAFWGPRPSELADHLSAEGHDVYGAPRHIRYSWKAWRHSPGIRARAVSVPGYLGHFRSVVRSVSPALVHANTILVLPEALIARACRIRTVLHVHEMLPGGWKGAAARRLAYLAADEVVAVSEANALPLAGGRRMPRVVHGGTSLPQEPWRRRSSGRMVVGTIGELSSRKGTDVFVAAAKRVLAESDKVTFRLVGRVADGPEREWSEAVLDDARRSGIAHLSYVDVHAELPGWDIFALPSRRDPFPSVVLEAMAGGLPVIGSAVDGIREQLSADSGVLVPPEDADALARAILDLAGRPDERARLGTAARRRVQDNFMLERQAEDLHRAYLSALDR